MKPRRGGPRPAAGRPCHRWCALPQIGLLVLLLNSAGLCMAEDQLPTPQVAVESAAKPQSSFLEATPRLASPMVGIAGAVLGSAFAVAFFLNRRSTSTALGRLESTLRLLAQGDYRARSGLRYSKGGVGAVARSVDDLASSLQDMKLRFEECPEERPDAQRRFQELFGNISEGAVLHEIICGSDGEPIDCRFLEANGAFERATGLQRAHILGKTAREVLPNAAQEWIEDYGRVAPTRQAVSFERSFAELDKDFRGVSFSPGKGLLASVFTDLTPQKRSEERLRQQLRWMDILSAVTRSITRRSSIEGVLRVALGHLEENLPVDFGGIALHAEGAGEARLAAVSGGTSEAIRRSGFEEGAILPRGETELFDQLRADRVALLDLPGLLDSGDNRQRLRVLTGFDELGVRSVVLLPVALDNTRMATVVLAARRPLDLTEHETGFLRNLADVLALALHNRELYQTLERSYQRLKQAQRLALDQERLKAMGQMASGIAHDISNAVSPISMYSEAILRTEPMLNPQAREFLRTIREAARDIEGKTARLRQFYRKSEDRQVRQQIDVGELMRQVTELTRPRWQHEPQRQGTVIRIVTEIDPNTPALVAEESEVREALVNLVLNAADAMPDGGVVTLKTYGLDRACVLEVTDSGAGMAAPVLRRCLEPFFTTKGKSGTGMGLSVVYGTMKRHGGDVAIDSTPGVGTTVRLSFPVVMPKAERKPRLRRARTVSSLSILCVDDDAQVLDALKRLLQLGGHRAAGAASGQEALSLLSEQAKRGRGFDVVITDLGMPDMDGRQLARRAKELHPRMPVILLSGWGIQAEDDDGAPECVDWVLSKPPRMDELRRVIEELHERSQRAAQSG